MRPLCGGDQILTIGSCYVRMTKGFSWSSLFYLVLLLCPYRGGKEG